MIEEQNNNSVQDQNGNKSKPLLPAVNFGSISAIGQGNVSYGRSSGFSTSTGTSRSFYGKNASSSNNSKPLLPLVDIDSFGTTNQRCTNGHTWTYAGSIRHSLENHQCDCGSVLYHSEQCECCGNNVMKPIPCNGR
jgi:hypothetical protein